MLQRLFLSSIAVILTLLAPAAFAVSVSEIIPAAAPPGARIMVIGTELQAPAITLIFPRIGGGTVEARIVSRAATVVEGIVPGDAISGLLRLMSDGAEIKVISFTVTEPSAYSRVATLAASSKGKDLFQQPYAVSVRSSDGVALVADRAHHQIRMVNPTGASAVVAGTGQPGLTNGPAGQARFKEPSGIAFDAARGVWYVADTGNHVIRRIASGGVVETFAGSGRPDFRDGSGVSAGFKRPTGLALDGEGNLYVADTGNDAIRMVTPAAVVSTIAGSGRPGYADGLARDALFHQPEGVAVTQDRSLYVADTKNHVIRKIENGTVTTIAGTRHGGFADGPALAAEFKDPAAVALDEAEHLIVADAKNHRIRYIAHGNVTTVAGSGKPGFVNASNPLLAEFKEPAAVAVAGAVFVADTKNDALRVLYPEVRATDVYPRASDPAGGATIRLFGTGFVPGATIVTIGGRAAGVTWVSATQLLVTVPSGTIGRSRIVVTTPAGTAVLDDRFEYSLPYVALQVTPASALLRTGETLQLAASAIRAASNAVDVTSQAAWIASDEGVVSIGADGVLRANASGSATVTATFLGLSASMTVEVREDTPPPTDDVESLPPDPSLPAPETDPLTVSTVAEEVSFLYTGPNAVQRNVASDLISEHRVATVRGKVINRNGQPLPGVRVTVLGHDEYGFTLTRENGYYDLAFNGGAPLTLVFARDAYIESQRLVTLRWNDQKVLEPVVLVPYDANTSTITFGSPIVQIARGSVATDDSGSRRATVIFPPGVTAALVMADGSETSAPSLTIRATELTVGPDGPRSMPAPLSPNVAYTYCVELSADEAVAAGAAEVRFSTPVPVYVENFIGFPVGTVVPSGWYDRARGIWRASENGIVLKVVAGGVDTDGDGTAEDDAALAAIGMSAVERQQVIALYSQGQTLWRVPVPHFTPWDFNLAMTIFEPGLPDDAVAPRPNPAEWDRGVDCAAQAPGNSVVDCHNQTLAEEIPIVGTEFALLYDSGRVARTRYRVDVPLTQATVPDSLRRVSLTIEIAGRSFHWDYAPAPNLTQPFVWDGADAYGRKGQGGRVATITIGYTYPSVFVAVGSSPRAWATTSGVPLVPNNRGEFTLTVQSAVVLGHLSTTRSDFAGWMFSGQQLYDGRARVLYEGNRNRSSLPNDTRKAALTTVAGNGQCCDTGDGGPALAAALRFPSSIAVASDGTLYLSEFTKVKRVSTDGIITTIAGTGSSGFTPDGAPPLGSAINVSEIVVGPDDTLYLAERWNGRVRRIVNGILRTVAGNGESPENDPVPPDGRFATEVAMRPFALAIGPDGTLYIGEDRRVLAVGPDGIVRTVAGADTDVLGDGGPAVRASVRPYTVAAAPDGTVYINDNHTIRRVRPDGIISLYAGSYTSITEVLDGAAATSGKLTDVWGMTVAADGTLLIAENSTPGARVRAIGKDGIITTITGTGTISRPRIPTSPLAIAAEVFAFDVDAGPDGSVYVLDYLYNGVHKTGPMFPAASRGRLLMPSSNGAQAFLFEQGRHVRTIDTLTGTTQYELSYDDAGRLIGVTDANGNATTIEREGPFPTAIVAPGGQRTTLEVKDGNLVAIVNSADERDEFTYIDGSLMATRKSARGHAFQYHYDDNGKLVRDEDSVGGFIRLSRTGTIDDFSITRTSAEGREHSYDVLLGRDGLARRTTIAPDGTRIVSTSERLTLRVDLPDGMLITSTGQPDRRFGATALVPSAGRLQLPSGSLAQWTQTQTATLADPHDPLSLTKLRQTMTLNGKSSILEYDASTRRISSSTPMGRQTFMTLDEKGRLQIVEQDGLANTGYSYDTRGRLRQIVWGDRRFSFDYDDANHLVGATDPLGRYVTFTYDAAGRVTSRSLPGGRTIGFAYDASGNVTRITPPGRPAHVFDYTPVDLVERYAPPVVEGAGSTTATYSRDRDVTGLRLPDTTFTFTYDKKGRLNDVTTDDGTTTYSYDDLTGHLLSIATPDGNSLGYSYDGPFLMETAWNGTVEGSVIFGYDNDLRIEYEEAAGSAVSFDFDDDGLVIEAGILSLERDPQNGHLTGTTLGVVTDAWSYNGFGETTSYTASVNDQPVFQQTFTRDNGGRVTFLAETVYGAAVSKEYQYDTADRLERVLMSGTESTYAYDGNGNRTSASVAAQNITATYDPQDRILTYGDTAYTYTPDGERKTRVDASGTTTYAYDARGNLLVIQLPDGTRIEYVMDGQDRRVAKKVNGTVTRQWLYAGQSRVVAELDGTGALLSRFVYGSRAHSPDYMERGSKTYRVISDHLGSPRIVVDADSGEIAQMLGYDEFGNVLQDSNPGFQPFGFAGGMFDVNTQLLHFGARDYDAQTGQWLSKDPIAFAGGSTNLYEYSANDPVNFIDPDGLLTIPLLGNIDAGEDAGSAALDTYAAIMTDPDSSWYEATGAAVGGFFAALWTPCTSDATFTTLSLATGPAAAARRPYWRYVGTRSNPHSRWMARGWRPPYGTDYARAKDALQLPNMPSGVERVRVPFWKPVRGPRPAVLHPEWGRGGGAEYARGWRWPE